MKIVKLVGLLLALVGSSFTLANELIDAAKKGDVVKVNMLLDEGDGINVQNEDGYTALMLAVGNRYKDIVEILLEKGASVDIQNEYGNTALIEAFKPLLINASQESIDEGQEVVKEIVEILLERGANVNLGVDGYTSLILAVINGYKEIVEILLKKGANVDLQDESGNSALMYASGRGHKETVEMLLEAGANVDLQDEYGDTALILAASNRYKEIVEMLLSEGADVNLQNNNGSTASMEASIAGHKEVINLLKLEEEIKKSVNIKPCLGNLSKEYLEWLENLKFYINKLSEEDLVWLIDRVVRNRNVGALDLSDIEGLLSETYNKLIGVYKGLKSGSILEERIRNILSGEDALSKLLKENNKKAAYRLLRNYLEKILDLSKIELSKAKGNKVSKIKAGFPLSVAAQIVFEY